MTVSRRVLGIARPRLVVLAIVAQAADAASFLPMVGIHGHAAEANPIVLGLAAGLGVVGVVALKAVLIGLLIGLLGVAGRRYRRPVGASLVILVLVGTVGALSNLLTMAAGVPSA